MRRNFISKIVIFAALLLTACADIHAAEKALELGSVMPEADSFKEIKGPFLYYEAYRKNELIGYCYYTQDVAPEIKGYSGPIEMLVGLDKESRIKHLRILYHSETPKYARGIAGLEFLNQFKGKGLEDGFIVGEDVDAITHATISCRSVASILKVSIDRMHAVIHGLKGGKAVAHPLDLNIDFYLTVLIITFLLVAFYLKINSLRYLGLLVSIVYFGFIKANFISITSFGNLFLWRLPDPWTNIAWYVFIFSGIVLTFLLGRFYCTYVCPFGGLQIFLNKIFKFNITISQGLARRLRQIRYILLWILIAAILLLRNPNIVNYEPFSTVFLMRGTIIAWSIASIILVLSLFYYRPFCSYFCAVGGFLDILSNWGRKVLRKR